LTRADESFDTSVTYAENSGVFSTTYRFSSALPSDAFECCSEFRVAGLNVTFDDGNPIDFIPTPPTPVPPTPPTAVTEPGTTMLFGLSLLGLAGLRRRQS